MVYSTIVFSLTSQPLECDRYMMFLAALILTTIVADGYGVFLGTFLNQIVSKQHNAVGKRATNPITHPTNQLLPHFNVFVVCSLPYLFCPQNGTFIGAITTCYMLVFCGFLIMFNHMSELMKAFSYLSTLRYSLEALVLAIYDNGRTNMVCPEEELYCHYV